MMWSQQQLRLLPRGNQTLQYELYGLNEPAYLQVECAWQQLFTHLGITLSLLQALNQGLGEGIFYRGRILLALCVEVYSSPAAVTPETSSAALGKVRPTYCVSP